MPSNPETRERFLGLLGELLAQQGLSFEEQWFGPAFPEDVVMGAWKAESLRRTMRVQERDESDPIVFDWLFGRSGADGEYDDLLLDIVRADLDTRTIGDVYRAWFTEHRSRAEVEELLTSIERRKTKTQGP